MQRQYLETWFIRLDRIDMMKAIDHYMMTVVLTADQMIMYNSSKVNITNVSVDEWKFSVSFGSEKLFDS